LIRRTDQQDPRFRTTTGDRGQQISCSDEIEAIAVKFLGEMNRSSLVGEPDLMLLEKDGVSIGVRNSGTQAKTNVSLRVAPNIDNETYWKAACELRWKLTRLE